MIAQSLYDVVSENLVVFRVMGLLKTIMFLFKAPFSTITIIVYNGLVRAFGLFVAFVGHACCLILFSPFLRERVGEELLIDIITCNWPV